MSTRLYPTTTDTAKLEKFARVPAGTALKLAELFARFPLVGHENERYNALYEDENIALLRLDNFNTFGWGRARFPVEEDYNTIAGEEHRPEKIGVLLEINGVEGVSVVEVEGLCWS
jgi:hypothetical protein